MVNLFSIITAQDAMESLASADFLYIHKKVLST